MKTEILSNIKCPLCKSSNIEYAQEKKNGYKLYICRDCNLFFINPIPSEKELDEYYNNYLQEKGYKYLDKNLRAYKIKKVWQERLNLLKKFVKNINHKSILEIGSGTGEWLETLSNNDITDFIGLEISKEEYKLLESQYKNKVLNQSLVEFNANKKFDIICIWDVLEHFVSIDRNINKIKELLKENGLIIFSTVNTDSISFKLKRADWRYFCPPEHIFYFNQKSIKHLANQYDFDILYFKSQIQLQAFLSSKSNNLKGEKINLNLYKFKSILEKITTFFLSDKGEIITFILRNKTINNKL